LSRCLKNRELRRRCDVEAGRSRRWQQKPETPACRLYIKTNKRNVRTMWG